MAAQKQKHALSARVIDTGVKVAPPQVKENDCSKLLWDFQIQIDIEAPANQPGNVMVDNVDKKAVVTDVAVSNHQEEGTRESGDIPVRGSTWSRGRDLLWALEPQTGRVALRTTAKISVQKSTLFLTLSQG